MSAFALPSNLPVGFRFHPTDEELINHFLKLKITGNDSQVNHIIAEVDFCKSEPWDLPSKSKVQSGDKMWWFFCRRENKYPSSARAKRTTGTGYWKITGQDRKIKSKDGKGFIGKKKTLVFYKGPTPGKRTNWVMQEYHVESDNAQRAYVICRLKKKSDDKADTPNGDEGQPSGDIISDYENQITPFEIQEIYDHPEVNPESVSRTQRSPDGYGNRREINLWLPNGFDGDHDYLQSMQTDDEELVARLIANPDEDFYEETGNNISRISYSQSEGVYFRDGPVSSDTDTEGARRYFQPLVASSMFGSPDGSKRIRRMRVMKTPSETLKASAGEHSRLETIIPVHNQFSREDDSSDDLTEYVGEINCRKFVKQEEDRPKYAVVTRAGHLRKVQVQKKVSPTAEQNNKAREAAKHKSTAVDTSQKEKSTKDHSEKGKKTVQSSNVEKHLETESCKSPVSKWKTLFTFEETSSFSSCDLRPPSEYCFNAVVGVILFVIFVRELLLYGSWC